MSNIRKILLSEILSSKGLYDGKYTESFNIIEAVIKLESKEDSKNKLSDYYFKEFKELKECYNNLDERVKGFPLNVLEQFLIRNSSDLSRYLYMNYKDLELIDMQVIELYDILERYFQRIYLLAVQISDHYSLEIKLKSDKKENESIL